MREKTDRPRRELWDQNDFEDLNSHSSGEPPQFDWFVNRERILEEDRAARRSREGEAPPGRRERRAASREGARPREPASGRERRGRAQPAPSQRKRPGGRPPSRERTAKGPPPPRGGGPRERREVQPRKRRKPMSLFKRRLLIVLTLLAMLLVTLFLAESLLLRVTAVQVTGDAPYAEEEIKEICGYKPGDNMLFLPIRDREQKLEAQLPYIGKAKISRKLPGTVVVDITAAQALCAVENAGIWLLASSEGKILESVPNPPEGVMQVQGILLKSSQPGQKLETERSEAGQAFGDIMEKLAELEAQDFTKLDLTDLNNIRLWYQDRVECQLGNTKQLDYKLQTAYGLLTDKIPLDQRGVLKLNYLPDERKSYFESENGSSVPAPAASPQPSASPSPSPEPKEGGGEEAQPDEEGGDDGTGGDEWTEEEDWSDEDAWTGVEDWSDEEEWSGEDEWTGGDGWSEEEEWTGEEGEGE